MLLQALYGENSCTVLLNTFNLVCTSYVLIFFSNVEKSVVPSYNMRRSYISLFHTGHLSTFDIFYSFKILLLYLFGALQSRWCHVMSHTRKLHQNTANTATAEDCCVFVRQIRHSYFAMVKEADIHNPSWCKPWAILKFQLFDTTGQLDLVLFFTRHFLLRFIIFELLQYSTWSRQQLLNIIR